MTLPVLEITSKSFVRESSFQGAKCDFDIFKECWVETCNRVHDNTKFSSLKKKKSNTSQKRT